MILGVAVFLFLLFGSLTLAAAAYEREQRMERKANEPVCNCTAKAREGER